MVIRYGHIFTPKCNAGCHQLNRTQKKPLNPFHRSLCCRCHVHGLLKRLCVILHSKGAVSSTLLCTAHTAVTTLQTPSLRIHSVLHWFCRHRLCYWDKLTLELQVKILSFCGACVHEIRLVSRSIQQCLDSEVTSLKNMRTHMSCCTTTQHGLAYTHHSCTPITHFPRVQSVQLTLLESGMVSLQQLSHITCLQKLAIDCTQYGQQYQVMLQDLHCLRGLTSLHLGLYG